MAGHDINIGHCSNNINHLNLFLHPNYLSQVGVRFTLVEQSLGQLLVVPPNRYHLAFNTGQNIVLNTGYVAEDSLPDVYSRFEMLLHCSKRTCGFTPTSFHTMNDRK